MSSRLIPGTKVKLTVRNGPAGDLLLEVASLFDRLVQDVDNGSGVLDDWGYAERPIRGSSAISNHCLVGDTVVWTYDGPQRIEDLAGTSATLLTRNPCSDRLSGAWVEAPVRHFGEHPTFRIVLGRGTRRREIRTTAEHRWFVQRESSEYLGDYRSAHKVLTEERITENLQPGDKLAAVYPPLGGMARLRPSPFGIMHGLTFGDGTVQYSGGRGGNSCKVVLWGHKKRLASWFPQGCPTSPRDRESGITGIEIRSLPATYKSTPSLEESSSYLAGWLAGYFAADGCVQPNEITMSSRSREHLEHVRAIAARFGIATREPRVQKSNGGYKPGDTWSISFARATVPDWMILRDEHAELLSTARATRQVRWHVISVEPTGEVEPVYCATVEGTGAFALDDWLLTGNSSGTAIDLNATRWSLGQSAAVNLNASQIAMVRRIVAATNGAVRWGGDYTGRRDPMHFEINVPTDAQCVRALVALRAAFPGHATDVTAPAPTPAPLHREDDPAMRIDIRPDERGNFHETVTLDGGGTHYVADSTLLLSTDFGAARFVVTARDHTGAEGPLYQWHYDLPNHGFAAVGIPAAARLLVIEGDVDHPVTTYTSDDDIDQRATRPAATVLIKAAS